MRSFIFLLILGVLFSCAKKEEDESSSIENMCKQELFGPCIDPISEFQYGATQLILSKNQPTFSIVPTFKCDTRYCPNLIKVEVYSDVSLPNGIVLDRETGTIMGSPTDIQEERTYTIVIRYEDVDIRQQLGMRGLSTVETFELSIKVKDNPPENFIYSANNVTVERREVFPNLSVQSIGGGEVTSYEISPTLPEGLFFNTSTGAIHGSPLVEQPTQEYIITAKNSGGQVSTSILITVEGVPPTGLTYLDSSISYLAGKNIPRNNLPLYSGDEANEYSVHPSLPRGLFFDTTTGFISGNPEEVRPLSPYTVIAENDWGSSSFDVYIGTLNNITGISTGLNHSCVIKNKKVSCSGRNEFFQLGRDTIDTCIDSGDQEFNCSRNFNFVEYNENPLQALSIVSTRNSNCSLGEDSKVKCWGDNSFGQLGTGHLLSFNKEPENVVDINNNELLSIKKIDSGISHVCSMNTSGNLFCWGDNSFGQLGELVITQRNKADFIRDQFGNPIVVDDFSTGYNSTCYVKNQEIKCLGSNEFFNLGDGTNTNRNDFVSVIDWENNILSDIKSLVLGRSFSLGIKNNNDIWSWGTNTYGQLGSGGTETRPRAEETSSSLNEVINSDKVYKGENSFCYIKEGFGFCLGENNYDFGFDVVTPVNTNPIPILEELGEPMEGITEISNGYSMHRCLAKVGELYCFGNNLGGQLGDGSISQKLFPTLVIVPE